MDTRSRRPREHASEFLLYAAPDGAVKVRVNFKGEAAWITQMELAELSDVMVLAVAKYLKSIFDSGELKAGAPISILEATAAEGNPTEPDRDTRAFLSCDDGPRCCYRWRRVIWGNDGRD